MGDLVPRGGEWAFFALLPAETFGRTPRGIVTDCADCSIEIAIFGVHVDDARGDKPQERRRPGPVGRLRRIFEQAVVLPCRQQDLVARSSKHSSSNIGRQADLLRRLVRSFKL